MGEITEEMIEAAAVGVVAELNDRSLLENIDDEVLTEINTELRARIRAALSSPREVGDSFSAARSIAQDAIEEIKFWSDYADQYFREKHDLAGTLEKLSSRLAALPSPPTEEKGK